MPADNDSPDISLLIPGIRLAPFIAVAGRDPRDLEAFYLWCEKLALALFADLGRLEVVMRSAMARELSRAFGSEWYARADLFDDIATRALKGAWRLNDLLLELELELERAVAVCSVVLLALVVGDEALQGRLPDEIGGRVGGGV